ncbi:MAG: ArV2 [Pseudarthrobacter sp.]|nr:ArV2 [Pseudarthrobacter sp.]
MVASKNNGYKPLNGALRVIGQSPKMGALALAIGERLAGNANAVGDSTYEAHAAKVTSGWANEKRAGAVVREVVPDWRDWHDAILVRVTAAMKVRGRK